jgi:FAD/FMN-containing dehydrogenase
VLRASEDEHPDLFWALRGGGGNFGVVTSFEYRMHQIGPMVNLALFFAAPEEGAALLSHGRELLPTLPRDATMFLAGLNFPPEPFVPEESRGQPGWVLAVAGYGSPEAHAELIAPVRAAVAPLFELVTPIPYVNQQQMFDATSPWGIMGYEKGIYLRELTDGAIDAIVTNQPRKTSPMTFTPIFCLGGAYADVAEDATAFGGSRDMRYVVNMAAVSQDKAEYEADRQWARDCWSALVPHAGGIGSYVNFMSEYEEDRVRASYGPAKYDRLTQLKREYDPDNVFHLNANIPPAGA